MAKRTIANGGPAPEGDADTLEALKAELAAEKAKNAKLTAALQDIGQYEGEGGPSTPWRQIVRDLGAAARSALKEAGQ